MLAEADEAQRRAALADEVAATRLQAHARGQKARKNMGHQGRLDRSDNAMRKLADWHVSMHIEGYESMSAEERLAAEAKVESEHPWAATRLQAAQRGRTTRSKLQAQYAAELSARNESAKNMEGERERMEAAARLQARQRGNTARKQARVKAEFEQLKEIAPSDRAAAVAKLQARQRGNAARRKLAEAPGAGSPAPAVAVE